MSGRELLSIVAPLYNEAAVVEELVARCLAAGEATGVPFELVFAEDASTDGTGALLDRCADSDPRVHAIHLLRNSGQFGATQAAIAASSGTWVCVLDGDLQDPPEVIPELWAAAQESGAGVVFATKRSRSEVWWFQAGQWAFHRAQDRFGAASRPPNAGSFSLMRGDIADRVTRVRAKHVNLAALVAVFAAGDHAAVPYDKAARYDDDSRVGFGGLVAEALGSLAVTGALERMAFDASVACGVAAVGRRRRLVRAPRGVALVGAVGFFVAGVAAAKVRRDALGDAAQADAEEDAA